MSAAPWPAMATPGPVDGHAIAVSPRSSPPASGAGEPLDRALIGACLDGDRTAFDALYRRHAPTTFRRLVRLVGSRSDAEDLMQQVFLEVLGALPRFRGDAAFTTWLYRITVNVALGFLRRSHRRTTESWTSGELDVMTAPGGSPAELAERRELAVSAARHLARLKPKQRIAFVLRHVEGLSIEEIARVVAANGPAVAQRIRKAEKVLSDSIARERRREEDRS